MNKKYLTAYATLIILSACSPTPQDSGDASSAPISGRVLDGYIANAWVYVDTNQNGSLDPWEPRALTDSDGFFGYNSNGSGVNYCALPETDSRSIYCLTLPPKANEMVIQISGGYDTTTGEPFEGNLSSWATRSDPVDLPIQNTASPISSLLAYMSPSFRLQYAALEGLTSDELTSDFLVNLAIINDAVTDAKRRQRTKLAMQILKSNDIIQAYLASLYKDSDGSSDLFGNNADFPPNASSYVMKSLATELMTATTPSSVTTILSDANALWAQIVATRDLINEDVKAAGGLTEDTTLDEAVKADIADRLVEFNTFVDSLFSTATNSEDLDNPGTELTDDRDIEARLRAVEVVTSLLRDPTKSNLASMDPAAQRAIDLALGSGTAVAADAKTYLFGLSSPKADVRRLTENFQTNGLAVAASESDFAARLTMNDQIGGGTLGTDTVNLDMVASNADQASNNAAMVFNPDGTMTAAINYADDSNPSNNMTSDTPLAGTWEQINDYTMLANIEVGGEIKPMIIRTDSDGQGYLFDFGDDIVEWEEPAP